MSSEFFYTVYTYNSEFISISLTGPEAGMPAKVTELGDHSAVFTSWPGRWRDHRAPGRQEGTKGHGAVASRRS